MGRRLTTDLEGCARCGGAHEAIEFEELLRPIPDADGYFTHWAACPTNGQPVLLRMIETG